ncbi:Uncharacterised protein [Klebsiella pneumoniae]|nr:Uncharacterised protein [Klebsiella pneumoniae]VGD45426.1 Uncharacterised protein [Klebsiella pneumoniae]
MLPRMVLPFCTSSVPVVSLLVHTTSGVSRVMRVSAFTSTTGTVAVMESDAVTSAVLMPLTVSAPVSGSYSITAPSGKVTCHASAEADGAGLSSEKIPGSTKAVSSSPPMASSSTCSPTEGAHHVRERPARVVSQFSHVV